MLTKSTKVLVVVSIILCLAAIFQAKTFGAAPGYSTLTKKSAGNLPMRIARIYFGLDQHEQLFEQFRKFAGRHAFAIKITLVNPVEWHYIVEIWGGDIEVFALDTDPGVFSLVFTTRIRVALLLPLSLKNI